MSSKSRTTAGKEDGKITLVPKLRFPDFQNAGEWENKPLSACLDYQQPTPYLVSDTNYSPAFKTPVLTAGKTFILGYTSEQHGIFSEDLPVIIFDDFTTASQFVDFPFKAKSSAMKILRAKNGANIKFMYETLQMLSYEVGAHERHWISNFAPMLVSVPKPPEQQKIADCLTSADELIAVQARKVDALKTHKKGVMQQLFPREGESQPRLRFPEFQAAGEWEETELGQRMEIKGRIGYRGYTVEDIVNSGEGAISISPSNITESGSLNFAKATYLSWAKYRESPEIMVERNFTVLVKTGSTYGKAAFVKDLPQECTINPQIVVLKPTSINPYFLYLLIAGEGIQEKIQATVVGGAIPTLSQENISKFKVYVPRLQEQQRIADCLTSLDDLISVHTQKLNALKNHKKGLMQQLFPFAQEVEA